MRILIEASSAYDQYAGIGRYARNVISAMIKYANDDEEFRMLRTRDRVDMDISDFERDVNDLPMKVLPLSRQNAYRLWFRFSIPIDIQWLAGRASAIYSPDFTAWHTSGIRRMITVHDLVHLSHPEHTVPGLLNFLNRVVEPQIRKASKIAVVSKATERDLIYHYGVAKENIIYAPNAVDVRFDLPKPFAPDELMQLGYPQEFALMVGTLEPRKNHINALKAYGVSDAAGKIPLLIAGRYGWGLDTVMPAIRQAETQGIARYLNFIPDQLLPRLMASARMLVFPSWNEGFGLPVAEMLATGGNVVISRAPALLEVAGDHGFSAGAGDIDGLAQAINEALQLPSYETRVLRNQWIRSRYSWENTALSILGGLRG